MRKHTRLVFVTSIIVAQPAGVLAQTPSMHDPDPGMTLVEARRRYQRGIAQYNLGAFDAAIAEFKAAYERSSEPELLFNIAQAYRLLEDYKQALFFYDAYLRLRPTATNRPDVEKRIVEMKQLVEARRRLQQSPPKDAIPPASSVPEAPSQVATSSHPETSAVAESDLARAKPGSARIKRIAGLVACGTGLALVTTGTYFGMRARNGWNDITQLSEEGGTWNTDYARLEADASRSATIAMVLIAGGGAVLLGGGLAYYLGWRQERLLVTVHPGGGGAAVSVSW